MERWLVIMGGSLSRAEEVLDNEKFSFSLEIIQLIISNYFLCALTSLREAILLYLQASEFCHVLNNRTSQLNLFLSQSRMYQKHHRSLPQLFSNRQPIFRTKPCSVKSLLQINLSLKRIKMPISPLSIMLELSVIMSRDGLRKTRIL